MTKAQAETKSGRLSLRLRDPAFVKDVRAYAKRHHTTVTSLVELYFERLLQEEAGTTVIVEAEQG